MSFIQNLFTSRDNNANAATYVGQQDRIWWNPDANAFYYSDGNTAGGIPIGSSSGNGMPHGPANSVQLNAGNGTFLGSSSLTFSGNILTIVGNATANYFIGDGSQLTNLPVQPGTYSNANVAAYLPVYSGNIAGNNIGISGAINAVGEITTFANIVASSGGFFIGNGSQLTGLPLANYTGNISGGNISITNTANLGNLSIQDETIYGLIADRDIVLDPAGNGVVNINGPFHVHSGNLTASPIFQVDLDGRVKTLIPNTNSYNGAFNIVGSTDGAEVNPQNLGVMLHTTGQATIPARIYNDGAANYAAVINRRYNGISSAPTGVLQNQIIGRFGATPYLVDGTWPIISTTRLDMVALEDQSTTAQGSAIKLYTVASGATSPTLTADFIAGQLTMSGNLNPALNDTYTLGNAANQWQGIYLGNSGVYIKDVVTGNNAQIQANASVLTFANINTIRLGNLSYTTTGIYTANSAQNIIIGNVGDTGNTVINNAGVKFKDGSVQTTAGIPLTQKGNALGVVPLNASTKIDPIYLPSGAITFKGVWNASNNNPTLADGTGTNGDEYIVSVAGTQNLGSGNITFAVGDFVLYTAANVWIDIPVGATGVQSFNGRDGVVTLQSGDVTNALSAGSIVNSKLANTGIDITYSGGLSGNASVNLGGTLALTNLGVTGITAGTGVNITGNTGNVTISIGQAVGTANSVSFQSVSSTTTLAATGNITGGNLNTGGQIIATGNILTSGFISATGNVTGGNIRTAGVVTATGNVTGGNIVGQNLTAGRVAIVGSGKEVSDDADFTYNSSTNVLTVAGNINASYFNGNVVGTGNITTTGNISASGNVYGNYGIFSGGNTVINATISTTGNVTGNYFVGNGSQLTGIISTGITTILPNALSNTTHIAANTVGNTATIITDATTANTANTIVVRDQFGAINVNAWAVNTKLTATNYTATTTDYWIGCSAKGVTITLPNAANGAYNGRQYQIADTVHSGNPNDTIAAQSPATVSGNPSLTQQGQIVLATYINGNWYCN